jgi:hypothetical protein
VCTQNARSVLTRSISIPKLKRDSTSFPLHGVQRDWCKACIVIRENLNLAKIFGARSAQIRDSTKC